MTPSSKAPPDCARPLSSTQSVPHGRVFDTVPEIGVQLAILLDILGDADRIAAWRTLLEMNRTKRRLTIRRLMTPPAT